MNKLIKNELYKIFHKKSIYLFLFAITALYAVITTIGNKAIEINTTNNYDNYIATSERAIEGMKENGKVIDSLKEEYVQELASIDIYKLAKERNIDRQSAEYTYIRNNIYNLYLVKYFVQVNESDYLSYGYESEEDFNNKLNAALKKLDSFVAMDEVKNDLNNLNKEKLCETINKNSCDEYYNVYKKVLEYRINHSIPYSDYGASSELNSYIESYTTYMNLRDNLEYLNEEEKINYDDLLKTVKLTEYKIDHNMLDNSKDAYFDSAISIAEPMSGASIFIIFGIIVIACGIISDEFDKGTIKQLLIKPYSRNKIVLSKIIATLISTLFIIIYIEAMYVLLSQLFLKGFDIRGTTLEFDYKLGKVVELNGFQLFGLHFLYRIPYFILFTLILLFISALTRNTSISAVGGFMLVIVPEFLTLAISKFKYIAYLPFYTWRLADFIFGNKSSVDKILNLNNSLMFDCVYIVIFTILILLTFKHTDIKNQ